MMFALGVATIPLSGIAGWTSLGELAPLLSTYLLLPAVLIAVPALATDALFGSARNAARHTSWRLPGTILFIVCLIVCLSFVVNMGEILTNVFQGRRALEKFASSFMVVLYGFALSYFVYFVVGTDWRILLLKPIAVSAMLCIGFSVFEILSRQFGLMNGVFNALDSVVHSGAHAALFERGWDSRIRSLAFEPPDFGNFVGYAWPWLLCGCLFNAGASKARYAVLWLLLTALAVYSGARTGLVMMIVSGLVLLALRFVYIPPDPHSIGGTTRGVLTVVLLWLGLLFVVAAALGFDAYEQSVIGGSSVSDLSRLASIKAALAMFTERPVLGFGLGQFGFFFAEHMPAWGRFSHEVNDWLTNPPKFWPASYSVYARLASELGIVGLAGWVSLWLWLARSIVVATRGFQVRTGRTPAVSYALVASCFCVLSSGFGTDTVRSPMIWITLGLSCRYLFELSDAKERTGPRDPVAVPSFGAQPGLVRLEHLFGVRR
jgi:hypothetical protein